MYKMNENTPYSSLSASLLALMVGCSVTSEAVADVALEEIVVTSQKREQSLQDVPVTVNVLSGRMIEQNDIDDLVEVADFVPGMVFSRAPDDGLGLSFRGIGTPARSQAFDQSVALFYDGMFVGKGRMYTVAFFDVDRIEMIKGTQSTLLGKNTSIGAISIVSKKPGEELALNIKGGFEVEHEGYFLDAGFDMPISETLSVRLAGHFVDQDGWVTNTVTGLEGPVTNEVGLRLTALYRPSDNIDITLSYQYSDSERLGTNYQIVNVPGSPFNVTADVDDGQLNDVLAAYTSQGKDGDSFHDTEVHMVNGTVNVDFDGLVLTSVSSYAEYSLQFVDDFDFSRYDRTVFARDENYWQLSEELRLTSPSGEKIEYLAGIFYYKSNWESVDIQDWGTPAFPSPPSPISGQLFNGGFSNNFSQKTETISVFGQLTWNISDVLRATGGLRYTDEQKDILYGRVNFAPLTIWNTVANPPFPITPLEFSDSFVNGNINVQYDVNADVMVYASFGHGTKTGGYVETNTVPTANPLVEAFVDSETAKSYEIGTKMSLLENTANLNISVFYTTVDNFQETTFTGVAFVTDNIPLETKGIEVEAAWMATDNFRFNGALTYADARERNTGLHPAQAPLWTGYMGVTYEQDVSDNLAVRINGTVRHRSEMYNQKGHVLPSDAYTTLDASIALLDVSDLWEVKIVGRNLTNAITADFGSPNPDPTFASAEGPAQLRTIKLLFSYNF